MWEVGQGFSVWGVGQGFSAIVDRLLPVLVICAMSCTVLLNLLHLAAQEAEDRKMVGIRARAAANKDYVQEQMRARTLDSVMADTSMTDKERQLNAQLLKEAKRVVGGPRQMSTRL